MQTGYTDGAIDIGRQMGGQFTAEEIVRNFYGLRKIKTVDETGNVTDIDDELRDERSLRKAGVYDYYLLHKEALERYGVSEETILRLFPYVQFNKKAVTTASETPSE